MEKKLQATYQDVGGNSYRVEIHSKSATSGYHEITDMGDVPVSRSASVISEEEYPIVSGSTLVFTFLISSDDINHTDFLFESEYRDLVLKYYSTNGADQLVFVGYIQPDQVERDLWEGEYRMSVTANDGLKDLSNYDFVDSSGDLISGNKKIIDVLKTALAPLEFDLDFLLKMNTYEVEYGASDENTFLDTFIDTRRFNRLIDGRTDIDSCLDVLNKTLLNFFCRLYQANGKYYIQHWREKNTHLSTVSWDTLLQTSRVAADDIVDLSGYEFQRGGTLSMQSPVKELRLKFLNRNLGETLVDDLDDWLGGDSPWVMGFTNTDVEQTNILVATIGNEHEMEVYDPETGLTYIPRYFELANTIDVDQITDGDYLKIRITTRVRSDQGLNMESDPGGIRVRIIITTPSQQERHQTFQMYREWINYESPLNSVFRVDESGSYHVRVEVELINHEPTFYGELLFRDFDIAKVVTVDDEIVSDITFDKYLRAVNPYGRRVVEKETVFGDSGGMGDIARYMKLDEGVYRSTSEWCRAGESEALPILYLFAKDFLSSRQKYNNVIRVSVYDDNHTVGPNKIIQLPIRGALKDHVVLAWSRDDHRCKVSLDLVEMPAGDVSMQWSDYEMTSIDGVPSRQTTVIDPHGGSEYVHPTGFEDQPETPLTGSEVISQIKVSPKGHVTGVIVRSLTNLAWNETTADYKTNTTLLDLTGIVTGAISSFYICVTALFGVKHEAPAKKVSMVATRISEFAVHEDHQGGIHGAHVKTQHTGVYAKYGSEWTNTPDVLAVKPDDIKIMVDGTNIVLWHQFDKGENIEPELTCKYRIDLQTLTFA